MKKRLLLLSIGIALTTGGYLEGKRSRTEEAHATTAIAIPESFGNVVAAYSVGAEVWYVMENSKAEIRAVRIRDGYAFQNRGPEAKSDRK
jgi:hypothetical protein